MGDTMSRGRSDAQSSGPLVGFGTEEEMRQEIIRLRGWLEWLAVDDPDAQHALEGEPPPGH